MSLSLFPAPTLTVARPRTGRPRAADSPEDREKHLAAAKARLLFGARVKALARYHDVDVRTIRRWIKAALGYDCPESARLRRLATSAVARRADTA